jgi:uncharacterized membrane protein
VHRERRRHQVSLSVETRFEAELASGHHGLDGLVNRLGALRHDGTHQRRERPAAAGDRLAVS